MKLLALQIKNIGNIEAAELRFDDKGSLVPIIGDNEAGKSTVINALEYLFSGGKDIPNSAVKKGEKKGEIIGILEGYKARRVIKDTGSPTLEVKTEEGESISSPQKFLDKLSAKFPDPHKLSELKTPELYAELLKYGNVDMTDIDAAIKTAESIRVDRKRSMDKEGKPEPVVKVEPVDVKKLFDEKEEIRLFNEAQDSADALITSAKTRMKTITDEIAVKEAELKALQEREKKGNEVISKLPAGKEKKPIAEIEKKVAAIEETNAKAALYTSYLSRKEKHDELQTEWDEQDSIVKAKKAEKEKLLKTSLPLAAGMEVDTFGEITAAGVAWESLSTSQRLLYGVDIAMKVSPELKTLYIKRGESILSKKKKELEALAGKEGYQIIMEIAQETLPAEGKGFFIEEGIVSAYDKESS